LASRPGSGRVSIGTPSISLGADDRIYIPKNGSPSAHILKPDSPRLPGGVQNEAFCLTLARAA
jgi:serine/threonine-protein kinase HipA